MAEETTEAGGVEITTGSKDLGEKALDAAPFVGDIKSTFEAGGKLTDGATGSEITGVLSEGTGLIQSCMGTAGEIAMDPIGWLVGQGLDFLISICQPLEDMIHFVSGDGPALSQAAENFGNIGTGIQELSGKFQEELSSSITNWGGEASAAAGTKLADFAKGIDGVAGQAGELAQLLQMSSMVMTVIEEFIKAILTELITWLIMIWIPALASAGPTFGASTAAAGTATGVKATSTVSRGTRMVDKLKRALDAVMDFLRGMRTRMKNLGQGMRQSMDNKRMQSALADMELASGNKSPLAKLMGNEGMVGSRVQQGLGGSIKGTLRETATEQADASSILGHTSDAASVDEYGQTGDQQSKSETEDHLDI